MTDHPLAGDFSVEASARRVRHYRYAEERMMRMLGGWIALTPELSAKLLMGHHVWDLAQHCDAFGRRLPELRAHAQVSEAANLAVAVFMDAIEEPEESRVDEYQRRIRDLKAQKAELDRGGQQALPDPDERTES